ncbi:MAG: hypothetical protein M3237_03265 [Actinomycetota bacterium]|nr:hypothetical protein [Actinomycetota bacterium]
MSRNLGDQGAHAHAPALTPPAATRAATPGWRDPRMWVGIAIVAVSVVAGARLLAAADDTVAVWAVVSDLGPGDQLTGDDLVSQRVHFSDEADLGHYFSVDDELPADLELTRGVGAGELLPRAAVGRAGDSDQLQVRIAVDNEQVPSAVDAGSVVHVYLVSATGDSKGSPTGEPALEAVTVVDAPPVEDNFTTTGNRTIDVLVTEAQAQAYFARRAELDDPVVTVVKVG